MTYGRGLHVGIHGRPRPRRRRRASACRGSRCDATDGIRLRSSSETIHHRQTTISAAEAQFRHRGSAMNEMKVLYGTAAHRVTRPTASSYGDKGGVRSSANRLAPRQEQHGDGNARRLSHAMAWPRLLDCGGSPTFRPAFHATHPRPAGTPRTAAPTGRRPPMPGAHTCWQSPDLRHARTAAPPRRWPRASA
jgi:hypothetical protein